METAGAGNPTAILSVPPGDPTRGVTPAPRRRPSVGLLDDEKTGAVLLFSGLFLILVGVTSTAMGWHHYRADPNFEWTQLLGLVLISGGGAFVLTGVCRFGITWPCRDCGKEALAGPAMEQTSTGHSFSSSAINQPTALYNATAMVCFPPQYIFTTQEVRQAGGFQAGGFQPGGPVNGVHAACPPYACVDNVAFTAGEEETDPGRSRIERTNERGCGDEGDAACSPPPAYEDICPNFNHHNGT